MAKYLGRFRCHDLKRVCDRACDRTEELPDEIDPEQEWEHLATFSKDDYLVRDDEKDDTVFHVFRRRQRGRTTDHHKPLTLADVNQRNQEYYRRQP